MVNDNIQKRTLSIRISTNGFCFCSYLPAEPDSLQYHFYKTDSSISLVANLRNAVEECPLISAGTEYSIKAIIETAEFTTLPTEFDRREDYKLFYRYCFPKADSSIEIVANKLNAQELTLIFPVDKGIAEIIEKIGEVTYYTPASILLGYLALNAPKEDKYLLAYIQDEYAMLLSIKNGKVELNNIFRNDEGSDTLFYLLSTWKEQGLSQTDDTLYICGDKGVEEQLLQIGKFIKNYKRLNPNKEFAPSLLNKIKNIPFDLQALLLCE